MSLKHYQPLWAVVNLKNLDHNFKEIKKLIAGHVKVLVPVKANAYGHGLIEVSRRLEFLGVDYLGVASIDEGAVLRSAGIKKPILVLSTILPADTSGVVEHDLEQTIATLAVAKKLNENAKKKGIIASVHIKVDTGMHRIGIAYDKAFHFAKKISSFENLAIKGIFTHFPCADINPGFTRHQVEIFNHLIGRLEAAGIHIPLRHASNSLGVIDFPEGHFNLVRPGLMAYGLSPREDLHQKPHIKLRPLLALKTKILHLNNLPAGSGISYAHTHVAARATRVATLAVGYGDGYLRCLSNKAYCLICGKRAKVIGNICMDQTMVDVTGIKGVRIGREVVLIGKQKSQAVACEELARLAGTIPYEIACNLGRRIRWTYIY